MAKAAAAVATRLPAAQAPDEGRKLLLTAVPRGHTSALQQLLLCKPVQQHLDAVTAENMMA
jgi:hypothetical protein